MKIEIEIPDIVVLDVDALLPETNLPLAEFVQQLIVPRVIEQVQVYRSESLDKKFRELPLADKVSVMRGSAPVVTASLTSRVKSFFGGTPA